MNISKIFLFVILLFVGSLCLNANTTLLPKVDERFELTSIVFRLAEAEEYVNNQIKPYTDEVDTYFSKYKSHPLIAFLKEIREKNEVGYDAVAISASFLKISNNKVQVNPQENISALLEIDSRWTEQTFSQYVKLLNDFYRKSGFNSFYKEHEDLYRKAESNLNELLKSIDTTWFESFYGKPFHPTIIYLAMCNGKHNYALPSFIKGKDAVFEIVIGCSNADNNGIPVFNRTTLFPVLIHELAHHFTNPLILEYSDLLSPAAQKMYPYVEQQLARVGYGTPEAIFSEGLNNLFTIMYFKEHPFVTSDYMIARNEMSGFVWMEYAVNFMKNFDDNRNIYPFIDKFMPQLVSFLDYTAENMESAMEEYYRKTPRIVSIFPALDSRISPDIKEIRINFSHKMRGSIGITKPTDTNLQSLYGNSEKDEYWSEDIRTLVFPVNLEKNTPYGLILQGHVMQSQKCYPMKEDFEIRFYTTE